MNYKRIHDEIIMDAILTPPAGYAEEHHIVPRCMGGTDDTWNLVLLSARQHFIIHWLLTKIHPDHAGLRYAFHMMFHPTSMGTRQTDWVTTRGRVYERHKRIMAQATSDRLLGVPKSEEHKEKIREGSLLRWSKVEKKPKKVWVKKPRQPMSAESIAKMKATKAANPNRWTPERHALHRLQREGWKQTESQRKKSALANSKTWRVTTPKGETTIITNLRQFCKEHGLNQGNLSTYGQTKGYYAEKVTT